MASNDVERLDALLAEIEVSPAQLRRDPSGEQWLCAEARALTESSDDCRVALQRFVDDELSLLGALDQPSPAPACDPLFTARVVSALPTAFAPSRLSPRRRLVLLGMFYLAAGVAALAVLAMVPESTSRWAEQAHDVLSWGSSLGALVSGTSAMWFGVLAVAAVAGVVVFGGRQHTPAG